MLLLSIILFIAVTGLLSFHRVSLKYSAMALILFSLVMNIFRLWPFAVTALLVLLFLPFVITSVRKALFSSRLMLLFRKVMPPMSQTEKEAIDAGAAGAISGSAIVKIIEQHINEPEKMLAALKAFVQPMKATTRR